MGEDEYKSTQTPFISIYIPTWNRQQLGIRGIKKVLRHDYDNREQNIEDDSSSTYEHQQNFFEDLN
ncbi:hypothetical protein ACVGW3_12525, partial [Enterobacter hormaechei]